MGTYITQPLLLLIGQNESLRPKLGQIREELDQLGKLRH